MRCTRETEANMRDKTQNKTQAKKHAEQNNKQNNTKTKTRKAKQSGYVRILGEEIKIYIFIS